jgi:hypothetical protein
VECHVGWRSAEVESRAVGWSAALLGGGRAAAGWRAAEWSAVGWMEQERLSASVSILGVLVIGRPDGGGGGRPSGEEVKRRSLSSIGTTVTSSPTASSPARRDMIRTREIFYEGEERKR